MNNKPTEAQLPGCPFCGSTPNEFEDGEVACSNRKCEVRPQTFSREAWSRRAAASPAGQAQEIWNEAITVVKAQAFRWRHTNQIVKALEAARDASAVTSPSESNAVVAAPLGDAEPLEGD